MQVTEADIAERYGWTFDELDEQDSDRVYEAFALQNIRDSISRIKHWVGSQGQGSLSNEDMVIMKACIDADEELRKELNNA
mgnify:FL=1